ncbi:MAG TPA: acyl-CoA dehydrogenase family protein [Woeseiaceae bacterium]|nr:acyl-CoA dehydrogenase family protein [Candidatus Krumholzibacteria bacterium]HKL63584.1 acyl-CoA dehydrogenase family protein [Woeseiaceae bacterium]
MDAISLDELIAIEGQLSDEERLVRETTRRFVRDRYLPHAGEWFEKGEFPNELIPQIADLGLLGGSLPTEYGAAGMNTVQYGLALQELEYGDSGLRSFVSVQGALCMYPIFRFGSDEQKERYLPKMAAGELIGCFGLTEPDAGSDPGAMKTMARSDGDDYVLNGAKMWITNSPIADLCIVWAKVDSDDPKSIRGFVVETGIDGVECPTTHHKMSLRASHTGEITLNDVRVPKSAILPGTKGLGSALACLNQARFGIAWGAIGAAKACFDEALDYGNQRIVFDKPITSKQLIQKQFADSGTQIALAEVLMLHLSRLKDQHGSVSPFQVSLSKRNNVAMALETARTCRSILGGNGISVEFAAVRHMLNLESVYTYEGTHEVHTLILGRGLTGQDAF